MKKRILSLICTAMIVLSLLVFTGCGGSGGSSSGSGSGEIAGMNGSGE